MPRFTSTTTKFDQFGRKVPKGIQGLTAHREEFGDCVIFDSKSEYETYLYLTDLEKAKEIQNLKLKVKFELVLGTRWWNNVKEKSEIIRSMDYIADFVFERSGPTGMVEKICLDCKGWRQKKDKKTGKVSWDCYYDDIYKIKKKIFLSKYTEYIFEER